MNKETIEKAAMEYSGLTDDSKDPYAREKGALCIAFKDGAHWHINSVWHDGNVSCQTRRKALVVFKNGNAAVYNDLRDLGYERLWGEVERFAYLDDLLPDRKEADR